MENNNKEESREFYVYKHIRKDNNTCFYVGKGKNNRIKVPKRNKHFNRIRKKYGCYVVKIKENLTEKEAFALEREIIEDYVFVFGYGINIKGYYKGYNENEHLTNCTWGGEGTSGHNPYENKTPEEMEEIGNKISEKLKGKIAGENNPMYGKHHSEEAKQKMSEKKKGKKASEEAKQRMSESRKGEKNGMFGKKGKDSPIYGEKNGMWGKQHSEESKKKMSEKLSKKIICITTGEIFSSAKKASEKYGGAPKYAANKNYKTKYTINKNNKSQKLYWVYLEDYNNEFKGILINPIINK